MSCPAIARKTPAAELLRRAFGGARQCLREVKTTGLAGGLHWPYKGLIQLRLKTHERFANRKIFTGCPLPGAAYYLPLTTGSPVNGSLNSLIHIWSLAMSSWSWLRTYSFIVFSLRPTVST